LATPITPRPRGDRIVETVLGAISTMLGYYLIVLTAAMVLIIVVVQIFKALIPRREHDELAGKARGSDPRAEETVEELAAVATAAVSFMLSSEKPLDISAWSRVERSVFSPWKIVSRSRRIQYHGG
jgi:hypothetical protein